MSVCSEFSISVYCDVYDLLEISSSDTEDLMTPPELKDTAQAVIDNLLPEKSRKKYNKTYEDFLQWKSEKKAPLFPENVLLSYFSEKAQKYKPSTLWALYSMLKSTLMARKDVNIMEYKKLSMTSSIYLRLLGQAVTLGLHASNSVAMFMSMQNQELMRDVAIRKMTSMQSRYLTVWNIAFQMAYFSLAFACDFLTVIGRDNLIPKSTRKFRQTFFTAVIFPVAVLIFTIFWPVFIYDRELLFPEFIDKIFSFKSNLVMHFLILPAVLWELSFMPRPVQKSHRLNLGILLVLYVLYNSFVIQTYHQNGLFPYPLFTMTYGTIYFPMILIGALLLGLAIYVLQWKLYSLIWGQEKLRNAGKVKFS